jgi:hypothetical protein
MDIIFTRNESGEWFANGSPRPEYSGMKAGDIYKVACSSGHRIGFDANLFGPATVIETILAGDEEVLWMR